MTDETSDDWERCEVISDKRVETEDEEVIFVDPDIQKHRDILQTESEVEVIRREKRSMELHDVATRVRKVSDDEENSAEDDSDSTETMNDYTFITTDSTDDDQTEADFSAVGNKWNLGEHSSASADEKNSLAEAVDKTMDDIDGDLDSELMEVLEDTQDLVKSTDISRFECPIDECGLGHSHSDHKHDIRSAFNVTRSFADETQFCPYCHCGANEMAMLIQFYPYIDKQVFTDQDNFEAVLGIDTDKLLTVIDYVVSGMDPEKAALKIVESRDSAIRSDLQAFLNRVREIQQAANAAPIAQETRNVIEQSREDLEEQTSQ